MTFVVACEDDIWAVFRGCERIGRAVSEADANSFAEALNVSVTDLRQKILDNVNDAIEEAFDGSAV